LDFIVSTGAFHAPAGSARRKITCDFSSVLTISQENFVELTTSSAIPIDFQAVIEVR